MYVHRNMWKGFEPCSFQKQKLTSSDLENYRHLRKAIQQKDINLVQSLMPRVASVDSILQNIHDVDDYQTLLHLAVISRCPEIVKIVLDSSADDVHGQNLNNETPLIMAAKMQNVTIIDLLLSGEQRNYKDQHGLSHLHIACMRGNLDIVRKLLLNSRGEDLNTTVSDGSMYWPGYTPLHFAVHFEHFKTTNYLLKHGADMMVKDTRKLTPLHLAHLQRNEIIIDLLLAAHKRHFTNPRNAQGLSHFHIACTRDDTSIVEHFLKCGEDINSKDSLKSWRPIHFAMYYECSKVVDLLSKTEIHLKTSYVASLMRRTYILHNQTMDQLYSSRSTKPESPLDTQDRFSAFHMACIQNNADCVEQLLSNGLITDPSDLNEPIVDGCTPLHLAVRSKSERIVGLLLDHGADVTSQDAKGKTALHMAFELKFAEIFGKILEFVNGKTPNVIDDEGLSVFHILCTTDRQNLVKKFLRRGVDVNIQVRDSSAFWAGFTPIHFAIEYVQSRILYILLRQGANISATTGLGLDSLEFAIDFLAGNYLNPDTTCQMIILILLFAPNRLQNFDDRGVSPIHMLCRIRDDDPDGLQQYLISHRDYIGKPIHFPSACWFNGWTPLDLCLLTRNLRQAKLLVKMGADLFREKADGNTPLELGFSHGTLCGEWDDAADDLFEIAIASMEKFKPCQFFLACLSGLSKTVKRVLDKLTDEKSKADFINCRNDSGETPLHALMRQITNEANKEQIVKLLLKNGADVNNRDFMMRTPLHSIRRAVKLDVVRLLFDYGADANAQNIFGETPLHQMSAYHFERPDHGSLFDRDDPDSETYRNLISLFLENGFDINIVDEQNRTCSEIIGMILPRYRGQLIEPHVELPLGMARVLMKHVKKLQILGLNVNENNDRTSKHVIEIDTNFNEAEFVRMCQKELEYLKSVKLDRCTTLHDILLKKSDDMTYYCENTVLQEIVESSTFDTYINYGFLIKLQIKNGRIRRLLLEKCMECLPSLIGKLLPRECLGRILQNLSDPDLRRITTSEM